MKLMLVSVLVIGLLGSATVAAVGDSKVDAATDPHTGPSDDTVREFHSAVGAGDCRLVERMIDSYPGLVTLRLPDDDPSKQVLPVFTAIDHQQPQMLSLLLKHGGSYAGEAAHETPLNRATIFGSVNVVQTLLNAGANVDGLETPAAEKDLDDPAHGTPLRNAVSCGHMEIARLLVQRGAHVDVFSASGLGWTGWVTQQIKDHPELTDFTDNWRYTPLCYAVAGGCAGTAEVLLSHGADVGHTYDDGGTLLHLATVNGSHDLIIVLLAHNVSINAKNKAGETAVDFAVKYRQKDVANLLREHGGKRGSELNG